MPSIFWIGCGFAALFALGSIVVAARSNTMTIRSGAAIGLFMGFMLAFPLIAIGISSS